MSELAYHLHNNYRTFVRKLHTVIKGPKIHPPFVRAAHYFSDGWVLNFWQVMDPRSLDSELKQIIDDGFNTIILVVPWREFQNNQFDPQYDTFFVKQLRRAMAAADRHDLSVIVRVGYSHQIPEGAALSGMTQAQRLLTDPDTQKSWLHYLGRLFEICHGYRSFRYGFLSWEEFWHAFARWQHYPLEYRTTLANDTGFSAYLTSHKLPDILAVPRLEEPEHGHYHAFINYRIAQMYTLALAVFPRLAMEIRVDKDRIIDAEGAIQWVDNDTYNDIADTRMTYWAPFMGAENQGEQLSAKQATVLLSHMLDGVSDGGSSPNHVVDQFNFIDEAPKFKGIHAEIETTQVADFLTLAAPLLAEKSSGYGIWAYRDYRQNLLYNARFLMGQRGWLPSSGHCKFHSKGGLRLGAGAILRQVLPTRIAGLQSAVPFDHLKLQVDTHGILTENHKLSVKINASHWVPLLHNEDGSALIVDIPVYAPIVQHDGIAFELRNEGSAVEISILWLYHYIYRGAIRRESGEPAEHHSALVEFNKQLEALTGKEALGAGQIG